MPNTLRRVRWNLSGAASAAATLAVAIAVAAPELATTSGDIPAVPPTTVPRPVSLTVGSGQRLPRSPRRAWRRAQSPATVDWGDGATSASTVTGIAATATAVNGLCAIAARTRTTTQAGTR